jgi:hypothetical protein
MMSKEQREQKLKALRQEYSGWVPQHELDKLDGIHPAQVKATEAIAERFAPEAQVDLEEAVAAAPKKRKLKVVNAE